MQNSEIGSLLISLISFLKELNRFKDTRRVFRTVLLLLQNTQFNDFSYLEITPPN